MHKAAMNHNRPFFKTIRRYLETVTGVGVEFVIIRNRLCPLHVCFADLDDPHQGGMKSNDAGGADYGWYPPLSVMLRTDDPRPYGILKAHYQGIDSIKARLQVAYFTALGKKRMNRFLIPAYVSVRPKHGDAKAVIDAFGGMVFGGLGSKVKIFNFDEHKIVSILKEGYDECFLLNEISVRENFQDILPVPKLLSSDRKGRFFEEECISATPLRELNLRTWPLLLDLFESLFAYYEHNTVSSTSTGEYHDKLLDEIKKNKGLLAPAVRERLLEIIPAPDEGRMNDEKDETLIVQAHGDFWLGNILHEDNGNRLVLVDWERTDTYSLMHDFFTFFAVYALEQGDIEIINGLANAKNNSEQIKQLLGKYKKHFSIQCDSRFLKRQLEIFLMERLCFALRLCAKTPCAYHEAERELEKWRAFWVLLEKSG